MLYITIGQGFFGIFWEFFGNKRSREGRDS